MDAINFIRNYQYYLEEIENVIKPEFLPILKELKVKDPHNLIRPDTFFTSESDARGFVWTLILRQVRKMDKVELIKD